MAQLAPSPAFRRRVGASYAPAQRPALTLLTRPEVGRSSLPAVITLSVILLASLVTSLVLNVSMSNTSYEITRLQEKSNALTLREHALKDRDQQLSTPQELEKRARALGMVPAGSIAYIDLATGKIVGEAGAAQPSEDTHLVSTSFTASTTVNAFDYGMGNERAR